MIARSGSLLAVIATLFLPVAGLFAGGSIDWEEVRNRIGREDSALVAWVEQTFDIRDSGGATRVGRQADGKPAVDGAQIGDRVPPYEFPAKPKGHAGEYTLYLAFDYSGRDEAK